MLDRARVFDRMQRHTVTENLVERIFHRAMQIIPRLVAGQQKPDVQKTLAEIRFPRGEITEADQILQRFRQLTDERRGAVVFPIPRPRRHIEDIRRKHRIHRLVADGRRAIEDHHIVGIAGQGIQPAGHGGEERPVRVHVPILGAGEFDKGRIGATWHQIDSRPAGRLYEISHPQFA